MKISFDLDDVLASFQVGWIEFNNTRYGMNLKLEDFTTFSYMEVLNISEAEMIKRLFEFYETDIFEYLQPIQGAPDVVEALAKTHELYVITSRPVEKLDATRYWIRTYYDGSFRDVLTSGQISRGGFDTKKVTKADICLEHGIQVHIEDSYTYAEDTSKVGVKTYLLNKPWNAGYTVAVDNILRINSISDLLTAL